MNAQTDASDNLPSAKGQVVTLRHFLTPLRIAAAIVGILAIAVAASLRSGETSETNAPVSAAGITVNVAVAESVDGVLVKRSYTGIIKAARTSDLGFERTGKLVKVHATEGQRVEAGQSLALLDTRILETKRRQLEAARDAAAATLAELEAGPRIQTIDAARATVRELESMTQQQQAEMKRSVRLQQQRAISLSEFDNVRFGVEAAEARLEAAKRRLAELEAGTRQEKIAAQRAEVAQLDASVAEVLLDIEKSELIAPFAGTISNRYSDEGAIVSPAEPVLNLVEDQHLEAWIGVPADLAGAFSTGEEHTVRIAGKGCSARVITLLPELDAVTRTRSVLLSLDPKDSSRIAPGEVVRIDIATPIESQGFWVPTAALARGDRGLWSIYVVEPRSSSESTGAAEMPETSEELIVRRRDVESLITEEDRVLVRGTLREGDRFIASGAHRIVPGQRVRLSKPTAVPSLPAERLP